LGSARITATSSRAWWVALDVLEGLVGGPARGGDPRQKAEHLDVEVGIGHRHGDLIERAAVDEHREGVHQRHKALPRKPPGHAEQVLLGDPAGDEPIRICVPE